MTIQIFEKNCLFYNNKTIIYGEYIGSKKDVKILFHDTFDFKVIFSLGNYKDFYIEIPNKITFIHGIQLINNNNKIFKKDVYLKFPFENCDLLINPNSYIITTMCKDYTSRLDEWIEYNINLGFHGIVIFNNDKNESNNINESTNYFNRNITYQDIYNKYKGKVWIVDFPYSTLNGNYWNTLQVISLTISVNEFKNKCSKIALIDADEFIYLPSYNNICNFFLKNKGKTITMKSNLLTNKSSKDIINNNILDISTYIGGNKYEKTILDTSQLNEMEFIVSPHRHPSEIKFEKNEIIHYHCWFNDRLPYKDNMIYFEELKNFKKTYKT